MFRIDEPLDRIKFCQAAAICSITRKEIAWWADGGATAPDFTSHHVLFQKEDKDTYIETLLKGALQG